MSQSKNLPTWGKGNWSNIFIPCTFPMQCNLKHITQEKLLEIHASQNTIYWMSLALQEAGTIGESKAAGKSEKSPCQGAENGSWEASTRNSQKIDIISVKRKNLKVLLGGGREGVMKEIPDQSWFETPLWYFKTKYALCQASWTLLLISNRLDVIGKINKLMF